MRAFTRIPHLLRVALLALLGLVGVAETVEAQARTSAASTPRTRRRHARRRPRAHDEPGDVPSMSIGRPNRGVLLGGVPVVSSETMRVRSAGEHQNFGTEELVGLLQRGAAAVAERFPGSVMHVGDLSREDGGRFGPHRSHRSGRDADVGFYLVDREGSPHEAARFHDIGRDGQSRHQEGIAIDLARTWALVEVLVSDDLAPVQYIFVAAHVRAMLLEEGARQGASAQSLERAEQVLTVEAHHTNHLHIRVYCPVSDVPRCEDEAPYHAWVDRTAVHQAVAAAHALERRAARRAAHPRRSARTRSRRSR